MCMQLTQIYVETKDYYITGHANLFYYYSASIMDTALPQKFPFILDRNLAKANCTENQDCMSCDIVGRGLNIYLC